MNISLSLLGLAALVMPLVGTSPTAQDARSTISHYNLGKKGLAIEGHDPVAYFPVGGGEPKKGRSDLAHTHRGVTYHFASEANRKAFIAAPDTFEPAYGGWCAYAMAKNDKVEIDPESFLIEDGKLLLFYDGWFNDTRKSWLKAGSDELRPKADRNWKSISGEGAARDTRHFNLEDGLALEGYDPTSYFSDGGPRPGSATHAVTYKDVDYRFTSAAQKDAFLAAPDGFEAGYGGYCAWAMAQGKKVEVDPKSFVVENGELLLFYNNAKRDEWKANAADLRARADREWRKLHTAG